MSPASKSKSKEKKVLKDVQKASVKPPISVNATSGGPANAYNPLLRTFQILDSITTPSSSLLQNGRFRSIDEPDVTGVECDSVSNNGSWSGESEDQKEKASNPSAARQESIPGADNDKREKIRQKNEKKHQRQKEKRAQELYEKCSGYLMSRKLELLAQQLVAMGFSQERAMMALIANEGKVEESVDWLFDKGEEEAEKQSTRITENLKIDIREELAKVTELEVRYNCTKQEAERAVVTAEGDLEKAEESLRAEKQENASAPPKPEDTGDFPTSNNGNFSVGLASPNSATKSQPRMILPPAAHLARDHKDFNYTKAPSMSVGPSDHMSKTVHAVRGVPQSLDWAKPQQTTLLADRRWLNPGSNPSVSYSVLSSLQTSPQPAKAETRYIGGGNELRNLQPQPSIREPITMMQRTQSMNRKVSAATSISASSPPGTTTSWYPAASFEVMKSNGFAPPQLVPSARSPSPNNLSSNLMYQQLQSQRQQQHQQRFNKNLMDSTGISRGNALWSRNSGAPSVAAASSLGFFSGLGSSGALGASSPVDWSTGGSLTHLDYTTVDWSLDRGLKPSSSPRSNGLWLGSTSPLKSSLVYDSNSNGFGFKPAMGLGVRGGGGSDAPFAGLQNGDGAAAAGLQNGGGVGVVAEPSSSTASSREWTSPFEGKDIFSLPKQFVSSPFL